MIILQESIYSFIQSAFLSDIMIVMNHRLHDGRLVDLFFPQHQLGIAVYSSSQSSSVNLEKLLKFENCADIRMVHIWEDQWQYQRGIIESRLLSAFGKSLKIHGRQTEVRAIDNQTLLQFLSQNHLQVAIKARYRYGLFHLSQLVAVASFSKGRRIDRNGEFYNSFELMRFCNRNGLTVVGGLSKLMKHFVKNVVPDDVMTYVDKDWPGGKGFARMGFEYAGELPVIELWLHVATGERHHPHRVKRDVLLDKKFSDSIELTDGELKELGYRKVYAGGSVKLLMMLGKTR